MPKIKTKEKPEGLESVGLQLPAELYTNVRLYCVSAKMNIREFFIEALSARLGRVTGKPARKGDAK